MQIRPMFILTRGISLVFFSFSLSMALCAVVQSPTYGFITVTIVALSTLIVTQLRAHMVYSALLQPLPPFVRRDMLPA